MASIFFSYSHVDEALRDRLEVCLAMLKRQGLIDAWNDRRIPAGDDIDSSISEALDRADLILILVSPEFLASRYCYDVEMKRALERQNRKEARLIPVILRQCDWKQSEFSGLKAIPKDGKPITKWPDIDEAFQDVVDGIRAALPRAKSPDAKLVEYADLTPRTEVSVPRSSNLRLAKTFTEVDQDRFLDEVFDYMSRFFEGSLEELKRRNQGIETTFRKIDRNRFTAVVYRNGSAVARCRVALGGSFGKGITYVADDSASEGTMNEMLSVETDARGIYLSPLGMHHYGSGRDQKLSPEGASEYYWSMLIEPLQTR